MPTRSDRLPTGVTRVHPHTRRTLRTCAGLATCLNWVWGERIDEDNQQKGRGNNEAVTSGASSGIVSSVFVVGVILTESAAGSTSDPCHARLGAGGRWFESSRPDHFSL